MKMLIGQNAPIPVGTLKLHFGHEAKPANWTPSFMCFALTEKGKCRNAMDFIAQGNRHLADAISFDEKVSTFEIRPEKLPDEISKVVFCVAIPSEIASSQSVDPLRSLTCSVNNGHFTLDIPTAGRTESALSLCEVYRCNGEWKLKSIAQGFAGGVKPLASTYGVTDLNALSSKSAPANPKPVNLSKVTLEKTGDKISLEKKGGSLGEAVINLNWQSRSNNSGGFFSKLFGQEEEGIDLDLGCLFEMKDGSKGAVQALGNAFGSFHRPPYIELDGDDRTGNSASGETMRINGAHWENIDRILVYAFIYDGTPAWDQAKARVSIKLPSHPEILVHLDNHSQGEGMCAIALLENINGNFQIRKDVRYFSRGHYEMDHEYGWGLRWKAGTK